MRLGHEWNNANPFKYEKVKYESSSDSEENFIPGH